MRFRSIVVFLLALLVVASALYLWRRPRPQVVEGTEETPAPPLTELTAVPSPSPIPAPALSEVQPTLDRVFDQTLAMDQATQPAFVAGDFNGDEVTDLAVAVRARSEDAARRLSKPLASWGLQDATAPPADAAGKPEPVKVTAGDRLLAVVHGVDGGGWRNPSGRQGYLVKNALGSGMALRPLAGAPDAIRMRANRTHIGDVIVANHGSDQGLILWTGATYVWADLKPRQP